ncbi:hypothetical protein Tco_0599900 [Tanacetum coccineum]
MNDPTNTMEEYIRIEEEKARRRGNMYNWETATYGQIWYDEDVHDLRSVETEFPAIVFDDVFTSEITLSYEPTVSPLNNNKIDFRISFDESDDEDYMMAEQDIPPPTITAMKIPIIRKGEYDIWSMRMRQYICHTDHNLWDVIVNGDLEEEPAPTTGETSAPPAPKTAKQLAARRNQERVKSILLLAIPDEYLLKFHNVADAKSL